MPSINKTTAARLDGWLINSFMPSPAQLAILDLRDVLQAYVKSRTALEEAHIVKQRLAEAAKIARERDREVELARVLEFDNIANDVDFAFVGLFNALQKSVGNRFTFSKNKSVEEARVVVSKWAPAMHEPQVDHLLCARQYVFSKFFNRYLSVREGGEEYQSKLEAEATRKFLDANLEGAALAKTFSDRSDAELERCLSFMARDIADTLGNFDLFEVYSAARHGANGTATVKRKASYTDVKYHELSGSNHALQQLIQYSYWDSNFRSYIMNDEGFRSIVNNRSDESSPDVVDATVQTFVPKKFDAVRGICPEHTVKAFHSQGVATAITRRLKKRNISFKHQPSLHRILAHFASLYPSMGIATLDWSEASTRIWQMLVERSFPESWYHYMTDNCRSERVSVVVGQTLKRHRHVPKTFIKEWGKYGEVVLGSSCGNDLRDVEVVIHSAVYCTMGNALTFPVQTLIFHSFLTYCSTLDFYNRTALHCNKPSTYKEITAGDCYVSSFGDDGILNSSALPYVYSLAPKLGWQVNMSKTFGDGGFRESCGGDYFYGMDVRPLMLQRPDISLDYTNQKNRLIIQAWSYVAANAAIALCGKIAGDDKFVYHWLEQLHKKFRLGKICVVPLSYPEGAGVRVGRNAEAIVTRNADLELSLQLDDRLYHLPTFVEKDRRGREIFRFSFRRMVAQPDRVPVRAEYPFLHTILKGAPQGELFIKKNSLYEDDTESVFDKRGCVANKDKEEASIRKVLSYSHSWL